jgi:RimK-like ATP-grasp domain
VILLWGVPSDPPLAAVEKILRRDGINYAFLDQRAVLDCELTLEVGASVNGTLRVQGETLPLEEIKAVYPRPYALEQIKPLLDASRDKSAFDRAAEFQQLFSIWLDLTPARVLNRPRQMSLNYSKPYQALLIEAAGFDTPETLLTTDPDKARAFRDSQTGVIYKSVSAVRSIVAQLQPGDDARLQGVVWCPTQFQQRISGSEVRIHVIGEEVFASEIVTAADDYRYAFLSGASLEIRPMDPPDAWADRCRGLAAAMGFSIAGIDLRCENGIWYCFEVNPSPGFTYYQERTGQPIDEAVARLLRS